ncbi:MAG TPA: trypsin-like peptidase domain-containing protein, partial [Chitinophagaceae bacterium]|nr:trypsin-like peptidase domain-containing protein [Chitinophagaceae bacterium]
MGTKSTTHTKEVIPAWLVAVVTTLVVVAACHVFMKEKDSYPPEVYNTMPVAYTGFSGEDRTGGSFAAPAGAGVNATVHITTKINQTANNHPDESFPVGGIFGSPAFPQTGSGSGVLISEDGYIVTNHHVIAGASQITVTLANGSVSSARLLGTDSVNDLAVLKIPVRRLPFL